MLHGSRNEEAYSRRVANKGARAGSFTDGQSLTQRIWTYLRPVRYKHPMSTKEELVSRLKDHEDGFLERKTEHAANEREIRKTLVAFC